MAKGNQTARTEQVAREDLVMFINACFACSGQREFYNDRHAQRVSIDFLHAYILGNYRRLYTRTLAAGINHFNQGQIILNLLATGRDTPPAERAEEGALIAAALQAMPAQRAWKVLEQIRRRGINNRRARAIVRDFLAARPDLNFDAVKYRGKVRAIASHTHQPLLGEMGAFLFGSWQKQVFRTPLFETFRQAHYSADAIYTLPFTIAEGLAARLKIPREVFLARSEKSMTRGERLRLQQTAARTKGVELGFDLACAPLTRLLLYLLSRPLDERRERHDTYLDAILASARRTLHQASLALGRVAAVLDNSYSSSGSSEKRRRPLAVTLGAHYLLSLAAQEYRAYWTSPVEDSLLAESRGQTNLASPLLNALAAKPDLIIIISDGCENDPPQGVAEVLRVFREKFDPEHAVRVVQCNPVFHADDLSLRALSPLAPVVGLRDAEDITTMLTFARFADGAATLEELEIYLASQVTRMLGEQEAGA